jgi:hypothetical protein
MGPVLAYVVDKSLFSFYVSADGFQVTNYTAVKAHDSALACVNACLELVSLMTLNKVTEVYSMTQTFLILSVGISSSFMCR